MRDVQVARGTDRDPRSGARVDAGAAGVAIDPRDSIGRLAAERIGHSAHPPRGTFAPGEAVGLEVLHDMTAAPWPWRSTAAALLVALITAVARA